MPPEQICLNKEQETLKTEETEKRFTWIHAFFMAFYSREFYRDVAQRWKGTGIFYLFILMLVAWLPLLYLADRSIDLFLLNSGEQVITKLPQLTIQQGEVSIRQAVPYVISGQAGKPVVVIDPAMTEQQALDHAGQIFILKTELVLKREVGFPQVISLPVWLNWQGGGAEIISLLRQVHYWIAIFIYPALVILSFIYRLIQSAIYVAMGSLIFCKLMKVVLPYEAMMRVSLMAITPAVLLSTIFGIFNIRFSFEYLFYFVLTLFYLGFGVWANRDEVH